MNNAEIKELIVKAFEQGKHSMFMELMGKKVVFKNSQEYYESLKL